MHYDIPSSITSTRLFFNDNFNTFINDHCGSDLKRVCIVDETVYEQHTNTFENEFVITIQATENDKIWTTCERIITELIEHKFDKNIVLIGIGGGIVTDIVGFVASIYKRGVSFGLVPTTILCMVDAAIGGKNGVNVSTVKNMIGLVKQPDFILYDYQFLKSLPQEQWINGFAEIIKHACILDAQLFNHLQENNILHYQNNIIALDKLIQLNVQLKLSVVQQDVDEKGIRKILNFGHTLGHAIEILNTIPHGFAISIGMVFAAHLSVQKLDLKNADSLTQLLEQYKLLSEISVDIDSIMDVISNDKKQSEGDINFILLSSIGKASIVKLSLDDIRTELENMFNQAI